MIRAKKVKNLSGAYPCYKSKQQLIRGGKGLWPSESLELLVTLIETREISNLVFLFLCVVNIDGSQSWSQAFFYPYCNRTQQGMEK